MARDRKTKTGRAARERPAPPAHADAGLLGWLTGLCLGVLVGLGVGLGAVLGQAGAPDEPEPDKSAPVTAARNPLEIPARDWRRIALRGVAEFSEDQIPAVAAGVTFFVLLSLFPAIGAFAALYGLVADVDDARRQIASLAGVLPQGAVSVIGDQMTRLASANHSRLGVTFAVSLVLSLWASNAGIKALIAGLNVAYEERERRNFIRLNLAALGFTVGAVLLMVVLMAVIAAAPSVLAGVGVSHWRAFSVLRWPVLLLIMTGLLSLLYRYGPCRPHARWRWVSAGGAIAAIGWMAMSVLFSWYVANFGHYDRTYGSLGAIVGFMTWIWLSLIVVLFGAELNSEIEARTTVDTTTAAHHGRRG